MKIKIDKRFATRVERSERVLELAEAFGLGLDDKEFVVFENLGLEIKEGDVVYITGQSGAGKSLLLRELKKAFVAAGYSVADIDEVKFEDKPLCEQIGKNLKHALDLMSIGGLTDANLYARKPNELSDGQRYRFRLAKVIESGAKVWVADEFLAILDRDTAKIIAMGIQKVARKVGATLIVATTHKDMVDDLGPDLYIEKRYREKIKVIRDTKTEADPAPSETRKAA